MWSSGWRCTQKWRSGHVSCGRRTEWQGQLGSALADSHTAAAVPAQSPRPQAGCPLHFTGMTLGSKVTWLICCSYSAWLCLCMSDFLLHWASGHILVPGSLFLVSISCTRGFCLFCLLTCVRSWTMSSQYRQPRSQHAAICR